jgi:hypothetical protein
MRGEKRAIRAFGCLTPPHLISDFPKYRLPPDPNQLYMPAVPPRFEGRFAIVTDVGRDAVDADALLTNGADANGEDVWS